MNADRWLLVAAGVAFGLALPGMVQGRPPLLALGLFAIWLAVAAEAEAVDREEP